MEFWANIRRKHPEGVQKIENFLGVGFPDRGALKRVVVSQDPRRDLEGKTFKLVPGDILVFEYLEPLASPMQLTGDPIWINKQGWDVVDGCRKVTWNFLPRQAPSGSYAVQATGSLPEQNFNFKFRV